MVAIVVVAHSRALATAAVELAAEMVQGRAVHIEIAAGLDEITFGTDAAQIAEAITSADDAEGGPNGAGVLVLMDLGSAVLSAELALELLDDERRERVLLCPAPLVEGLVVAAVSAAGGSSRAEVAEEAAGALAGKSAQLGGDVGPENAADQAGPPLREAPAGQRTATFTVSNPHGLHARPAARLISRMRGFDAVVELRNQTTESGWVPAGSLSKLATLGALRGHQVQVRAHGAQADAAVAELLGLAADDFGEKPGAGVPPEDAGRRSDSREPEPPTGGPEAVEHLAPRRPIAASPGLGVGPAWLYGSHRAPVEVVDSPAGDPAAEWRHLEDGIEAARGAIERLRVRTASGVGADEAGIFDAHLALLEDTELLGAVRARIDSGRSAAAAWSASIAEVHAALSALADPYLRARAADVASVGEQVLRALLGTRAPASTQPAGQGVLVAGDLTPAEAAELDRSRVLAVVLAYGSPTAHSTILLRSLGIPAVVAAGAEVLDVAEGTTLAVDGSAGELIIDPPAEVRDRYLIRAAEQVRRERQARARSSAPSTTRDGVDVLVGANLGSVRDALTAHTEGADFAGLVRTEFLFLNRAEAPDVDEQEATYREIAAALDSRRITLRTLDVGGDKPLGYQPVPPAPNPFLGLRGIRLSLARPRLLTEQLVAMVLVAHDVPVSVMFPMVSTLDELRRARMLLDDAIKQVGRGTPPELQVGIMVEVPAAALKAAAFDPHVDFFSIGTNDLTQYTLAAERGNDTVASLGDPFDPGVLRLIDSVCRAASGGTSVAVCGELAADERATALLLGLGVDELSVAPRAVPGVKQAVRGVHRAQARALAADALTAHSADAVRALIPSADRAG